MKRHPEPQTPPQPAKRLPGWDKLPLEQRQALIIALSAMMVKWLPHLRRQQEKHDGQG